MVLWGVVFAFFGLGILPLSREILLPWESALYGTIMIGWGTTLFFTGRIAFRRQDKDLAKVILTGLTLWLIVEAIFSAYFKVWFNVGVDFAVLVLFGFPLLKIIGIKKGKP